MGKAENQLPAEGELLRIEIKKAKMRQEDFAQKMGFSRNYLLRLLEREQLPPDIKVKAAKLLSRNIFGNLAPVLHTGTPVYDLHATAGANENVSQLPELPAFHVKVPGYEDCNFGMYVYGHSMYPTIETGSLILCRRVNDKSVIMYGEIYLMRTNDYLMVKRLQRPEARNAVLCTSDNFEQRSEKFKRFEPFELPLDKILDLYLVKGIIKKTQV
jgi:DNA-binding XRE family transcriptional regulator